MLVACIVAWEQNDLKRRHEQEVLKLKKDVELQNVQHESNEASLRKRHQEVINDLNEQLEKANKQKSK
jgi:hypothetical protein